MLKTWFEVQKSNVESLANDLEVRQTVYPLLDAGRQTAPLPAAETEAVQMKLEQALGPAMSAHDYDGYLVANKKQRIVAAMRRELVGQADIPEYEQFLDRALAGEVCLSPPFPSVVALKDDKGRTRTGVPTMVVVAADPRREFSSRRGARAADSARKWSSAASSGSGASARRARPMPSTRTG